MAAAPLFLAVTVAESSDSGNDSRNKNRVEGKKKSDEHKNRDKDKDDRGSKANKKPESDGGEKLIQSLKKALDHKKETFYSGLPLDKAWCDTAGATVLNNKDLRKERAKNLANFGKIKSATGNFLPNVGAYVNTNVTGRDSEQTTHVNGIDHRDSKSYYTEASCTAGIRGAVNVLNGGKDAANIKEATEASKANFYTYKSNEGAKIYEAFNTALKIIDYKISIKQSEVTQDISKEILREDIAKMKAGEVDRTVVAEAEAKLANAEAKLIDLKIKLAGEEGNFELMTGMSAKNFGTVFPDFGKFLPKTKEEAKRIAERENAKCRAAQHGVYACRATVNAAQSTLLPTFDIEAGIARTNKASRTATCYNLDRNPAALPEEGPLMKTPHTEWSVGASFKLPIDLKGATANNVAGARHESVAARVAFMQVRGQVLADIDTDWDKLADEQQIAIRMEKEVEAREVFCRCFLQELGVGAAVHSQVLKAYHDLLEAKVNLNRVYRTICETKLRLLLSIGRLNAKTFSAKTLNFDPFDNPASTKGELDMLDEPVDGLDDVVVKKAAKNGAAALKQKGKAAQVEDKEAQKKAKKEAEKKAKKEAEKAKKEAEKAKKEAKKAKKEAEKAKKVKKEAEKARKEAEKAKKIKPEVKLEG
jgi:outer membrane protein TolC